eukprot:Hpha_TRINITY_DN7101_c0_g1::TRINITY_DN7101_c0_g1_i1::g.29847::m.29847
MSMHLTFVAGGFGLMIRTPDRSEVMGIILLRPPGTVNSSGELATFCQFMNIGCRGLADKDLTQIEKTKKFEKEYGKGSGKRNDYIMKMMQRMHHGAVGNRQHWYVFCYVALLKKIP